ncbi:MAG: SAM-dependent methyltransferase [Arenicella sp.]|jgi:SAM-dependent methyltransferase
MSKLVELNRFSQSTSGVYQAGSAEREFNYSDGEKSEAQLYKILSKAEDLSCQSTQLQAAICDWPTEYHLSSTRSNLLRPLNLEGVTRVLELGCGCGSITRFLGEQEGIQVDAVEGSPTRAGLAALRCRDLDNVTICSANFNDIEFPEDHYDLVLFVGVTEYAGRFSDRATDQEALADLLLLGKKASKANGVTLIAIENRLGLKYMLGASEDHYAIPFVGLDDYPKSTGIRTYSQQEWREHARGFSAIQFMYPFPDYKVPTSVIKEVTVSAVDRLKGHKSRDYSAAFDLGENEYRIWQGLALAGTLNEHANSFLIALSDDTARLARLCDFDSEVYPVLPLNYDIPTVPSLSEPLVQLDHKLQSHLNAQIIQLQSHSDNLQAKVDLMSNSIGWRLLNGLRRLFGKTII